MLEHIKKVDSTSFNEIHWLSLNDFSIDHLSFLDIYNSFYSYRLKAEKVHKERMLELYKQKHGIEAPQAYSGDELNDVCFMIYEFKKEYDYFNYESTNEDDEYEMRLPFGNNKTIIFELLTALQSNDRSIVAYYITTKLKNYLNTIEDELCSSVIGGDVAIKSKLGQLFLKCRLGFILVELLNYSGSFENANHEAEKTRTVDSSNTTVKNINVERKLSDAVSKVESKAIIDHKKRAIALYYIAKATKIVTDNERYTIEFLSFMSGTLEQTRAKGYKNGSERNAVNKVFLGQKPIHKKFSIRDLNFVLEIFQNLRATEIEMMIEKDIKLIKQHILENPK